MVSGEKVVRLHLGDIHEVRVKIWRATMDGFRKLLLGTMVGCFAMVSQAGVVREDKGDNEWEILLAPYLWTTSLKGTSQVGALPPMTVDAGFKDLVSNLNMALSLHTEFHRGKWAFVIDPTYLNLEMDVETPGGFAEPSAEAKIWLVEGWVGYKLTPHWEALGGARWQSQDLEVDAGLPAPFPPDVSFGTKEDWVDYFIGTRFNYPLPGSRFIVSGRGDVTVFGDSDSGYSLSIFLNRRVGETMLFNFGYRWMDTDYDNAPSYVWDVKQQGPVFGYTWSF
jgi:hypothetical protein